MLLSLFNLLLLAVVTYRFVYLYKSFYSFVTYTNNEFIKLKKTLTKEQIIKYSSLQCIKCKTLLPDGTLRTHTGEYLCSDCKQLNVS